MYFRTLAVLGLGVLCMVGGTGCASIKGSCDIKAGFDSSVNRIAVVDVTFGNQSQYGGEFAAASDQVADLITMEFFKRGYDTVERTQIEAVLQEQNFQQGGYTTDEDAVRIGQLLNCSAVVVANVQECGEKFAFTVKVVETETGSHLLMGNGKGNAHSSMTRMLAIVGGAVIGAAIGGAASGSSSGAFVGGLGGGFAGLVAGEMLAEDLYDVAKKTVAKTFRNLPVRSAAEEFAASP